ncbi:hypothetical protein [Chitinophaga nivalis]|uniref:Low affinity iron permease family protein n=1 Tax=Chitinophaga nivalis TaxID=2991709 RepID=A0ABT3IFR1_9BACT|nr:hypothetical protein [Chitinophaga nivalis]MCW3467520.1 hypothetical protein [Chitinophaga nivalis]MCW3482788.1 hypothetical protein [Chitinophaga nivalis]
MGGGTLLVLLAKNLPDSYAVKSWLVIAAPSITIAFAFIWRYIEWKFENYSKNKQIRKATIALIKEIDILLQDPTVPEHEKEKLIDKKQQIKLAKVEDLSKQLESIRSTK